MWLLLHSLAILSFLHRFSSNCKASNSTAFRFRISITMIRLIYLEEHIQHTVIYGRTHRSLQQEALSSISFFIILIILSVAFCSVGFSFFVTWTWLLLFNVCILFTAVQGLACFVSFHTWRSAAHTRWTLYSKELVLCYKYVI